ncbi:TIGR02444 family protein [Spiribacter salinus]|nr:TIGR02444 family protein [Spiribacter salinus]
MQRESDPEATGAMAEAVWQFTLSLYDQPGVASACLSLQARRGVGVSALLALIGLAAAGRPALEKNAMEATLARAEHFQQAVIEPLRAARRGVRGAMAPAIEADAHALRHDLQAREIEAERLQQQLLVADYAASGLSELPWTEAVRLNALVYLAGKNASASSEDEADLEQILAPLLNGAVGRPEPQRN